MTKAHATLSTRLRNCLNRSYASLWPTVCTKSPIQTIGIDCHPSGLARWSTVCIVLAHSGGDYILAQHCCIDSQPIG